MEEHTNAKTKRRTTDKVMIIYGATKLNAGWTNRGYLVSFGPFGFGSFNRIESTSILWAV